ncbi:hypothetical protein ACFWBN_26140 [Streptomyces sp. NPDC059989]|uniref:hypothetical protein n=1 Tax=Streptomyces sp. NPDC059989 TaxID=3347026 RepID=UPI0036830576
MKNRLVVIGSAVAASVGLCMAVAPAAMAQPLKVTVACGDVAALLTAVGDANGNAEGGTITLAKDCAYRFADDFDDSGTALPAITGKVKIIGHNSTLIRSVTEGVSYFRIISVNEGGELLLKGTTVTGGRTDGYGGGIGNAGTLRLEDSKVAGNLATGQGGGIHNTGGTVTLVDSDVLTNVVTNANDTDGDGGGISNDAEGTLTLKKSTVAGNAADGDGGGIANAGTLNVEHGLVVNNEARDGSGGGIYNLGTAKLKYTKVVENWAGVDGGGVHNGEEATLDVHESAIADNRTGNDGGGLNNAGTATLKKTKVESNQAGHDGGGINNVAETAGGVTELTLDRSTVAENRAAGVGGGINNGEGAVVTLTNSKIVKNLPTNCAGTVPGCA